MEETKVAHGTMGNQVPFLTTYCMPGPVLHILQTSLDLILTKTLRFTEKEIMTHKVQLAQDDTTNNKQNKGSLPDLLNSLTPSPLHLLPAHPLLKHLSLLPCATTCPGLSSTWWWLDIPLFYLDDWG